MNSSTTTKKSELILEFSKDFQQIETIQSLENKFYFVANKNGNRVELSAHKTDDNKYELYILDDFGACTQNEGDWVLLRTVVLISDIHQHLKNLVSDDFPLIIEGNLVLDDEAFEQALDELGIENNGQFSYVTIVDNDEEHQWINISTKSIA